ncbi:MAG: hypothetical protein HW405_583 [Candidatus Berkelbacteria bacterium]|nr:hypothetical protein [Candidatus Berkelbacteria bacterium]
MDILEQEKELGAAALTAEGKANLGKEIGLDEEFLDDLRGKLGLEVIHQPSMGQKEMYGPRVAAERAIVGLLASPGLRKIELSRGRAVEAQKIEAFKREENSSKTDPERDLEEAYISFLNEVRKMVFDQTDVDASDEPSSKPKMFMMGGQECQFRIREGANPETRRSGMWLELVSAEEGQEAANQVKV